MARIKDAISLKSFDFQLCPSSTSSMALYLNHNSIFSITSFVLSDKVVQLGTCTGNLCKELGKFYQCVLRYSWISTERSHRRHELYLQTSSNYQWPWESHLIHMSLSFPKMVVKTVDQSSLKDYSSSVFHNCYTAFACFVTNGWEESLVDVTGHWYSTYIFVMCPEVVAKEIQQMRGKTIPG